MIYTVKQQHLPYSRPKKELKNMHAEVAALLIGLSSQHTPNLPPSSLPHSLATHQQSIAEQLEPTKSVITSAKDTPLAETPLEETFTSEKSS